MIPFNPNAPLLDQLSATMLNNFDYNLKLTRSIVPILDRQFMIKRGMVNNLNKLLDMNLKVCLLIVLIFSCHFASILFSCSCALFQMIAFLIGMVDLQKYTQVDIGKTMKGY